MPEPAIKLPPVGAKVKLARDGRRWWDVRAADNRFAILTRQAEFKPKGELRYTILDSTRGVRGPCNLIGQSWDKYMSDQACAELLEELQIGSKMGDWNSGDRSFDMDAHMAWMNENQRFGVEVSYRNNVPIGISEIRSGEQAHA